ncbi:GGDEF domain-containing response regulator [Geobacter pickeringii]|uniref:GGDEF domain-containing response regulator n=1 Tax=Geobacter pickeringii TaxID=345632 RepID=UPI000A6F6E04|nr:GGDEF domain-containing response regulator [Geobacter pickeringii]
MLIIEDSEDDCFLLVRALKREFDVTYERVDTSAALRDALRAGKWDVILSDYFMPQFDAPAALAILQEEEQDLPFIIVSGKIGELEAVRAMKGGAHDYVMKGDQARLIPAIRRELREAAIREERRKADLDLREQLHFRQALIDSIPTPIFFKNPVGIFLGCNKAFEAFSGLDQSQIVGRTIFDIAPGSLAENFEESDRELFLRGGTQIYESSISFADRAIHDVIFYKATFQNVDNSLGGLVGTILDITERKQTEEKLRYMSTHDALTGLYNRAYFQEEMERLEQGRQFPVSIVIADVDRLKYVNDTLGHAAGDELIISAALVLKGAFRAEDVVARIGGDEFAVLLPSADTAAVDEALHRLSTRLGSRNGSDDQLTLSMSFGVATAVKGERLEETLKLADKRMYHDKSTKSCIPAEGSGISFPQP